MTNKIVTIDFDDVIADTQKHQRGLAKRMFGAELDIANSRQSQHVPEYLTQAQYDELIHCLYETSEGANIPLVNGARRYLNLIQEMGYLPKIVTARNDAEVKYVRDICEKERIKLKIFNTNYEPKTAFCRGSFAHLDDSYHDLVSLEDVVKNLILFDKPHNEKVNVKEGIIRVDSWKEFYSFLKNNN
ncbi:MAG: hypothetical protein ABIA78_01670 [archaeon]